MYCIEYLKCSADFKVIIDIILKLLVYLILNNILIENACNLLIQAYFKLPLCQLKRWSSFCIIE